MINVGVIGYGYWGPNIVRNFNLVKDCKVTYICDQDPKVESLLEKTFPGISVTRDCLDVMNDPGIDVVAIVTPVSTHFNLAKMALENGKHVFVEKPFTQTPAEAYELINLAEQKHLKIMVDHTFIFSGAVAKIKECIVAGELGQIYYYDSTRINLGLFRRDVNVIWDLAPHDFAIMLHLITDRPEAIRVFSKSHVTGMEDVAHILVYYASNLMAHFNVNWLSPVKVRSAMIGGDKRMLVWNDISPDEKIKIFDSGVNKGATEDIQNLLVSYRSGEMHSPRIDNREALLIGISHFIECITENKPNLADGKSGLEVVSLLQACDKSTRNNGGMVIL